MNEPSALGDAHFWIGCVAVITGFTAFAARKGHPVHRAAGTVFAVTMVGLTLTGLWLSLAREILFTVFLSALAFHALVTGWATARWDLSLARFIIRVGPVFAGFLTLGAVVGGLLAAAAPGGQLHGLPAFAFFLLAGVSGLLTLLDFLFVQGGTASEQRRLTRHLWRMGFSFFLATGIFFFGNNNVLPEVLRHPAFLSAPVLAVIGWTAVYAMRTRFSAR